MEKSDSLEEDLQKAISTAERRKVTIFFYTNSIKASTKNNHYNEIFFAVVRRK